MNVPAPAFAVRDLTRAEVRRIWKERMHFDFPANELKPLSMIEKSIDAGSYRTIGADDGEDIAAYAFLVTMGDAALFDYLAVRRDLRDRGCGSAFLKALSPTLSAFRVVLLESDDPDFAPDEKERGVRNRRIAFYERNGLIDTGMRTTVFGADYRVLAFPSGAPLPDTVETALLYRSLYARVLPDRLLTKVLTVRG